MKRVSVLVGNGEFPNAAPEFLPQLRGATRDVFAIERILRDPELGCFNDVATLVDRPSHEIERELRRAFRQAEPDDLILIYYAGHGKRDGQELFLCAMDTIADDYQVTSVRVEEVVRLAEKSLARQVVIILDCCFSGSAIRALDPRGIVDDQIRAFQGERSGLYMLCSAAPYQLSFENSDGEGTDITGEYTRLIVRGIESGAADLNSDGEITPGELHQWVLQHIRHSTPVTGSKNVEREPVLAKNRQRARETAIENALETLANWFTTKQLKRATYTGATTVLAHEAMTEQAYREQELILRFVQHGRSSSREFELAWETLQLTFPEFAEKRPPTPAVRNVPVSGSATQELEPGHSPLDEIIQEQQAASLLQDEQDVPLPQGLTQSLTVELQNPPVSSSADEEKPEIFGNLSASNAAVGTSQTNAIAVTPAPSYRLWHKWTSAVIWEVREHSVRMGAMSLAILAVVTVLVATRTNGRVMLAIASLYADGRWVQQNDGLTAIWYRRAAQAGNARAMFLLGSMYQQGRGVAHNDTTAVAWYRESAAKGDAGGMRGMGWMYKNGFGVPQQDTTAVRWYHAAAVAGDVEALRLLGWMYLNGRGVRQSDSTALAWLRRATEAGDARGMGILGTMYESGQGVPQSDSLACVWYLRSAQAGDEISMMDVAARYRSGRGITRSDSLAAEWYRRAAALGMEGAGDSLEAIEVTPR